MKEFGVFLPIANGGWIVSKATPPLDGGWQQNHDAALLAEDNGFDFVMAMGKWRGFGGETNHWGASLEAVTMMAGIAAVTDDDGHRLERGAAVFEDLYGYFRKKRD